MAFDYTEVQHLGAEAIREFGAPYKLSKPNGSSAGVVNAVLSEQVKRDASGVLTQSKIMLIAGTNKTVPEVGMFMTHNKEVYRVLSVERVQPGKVVVIYKAVVEV